MYECIFQRRAAGQRGGSRFQAKRRKRKENPRSTDDLRHRALKIAKLHLNDAITSCRAGFLCAPNISRWKVGS